MQRRYLLPVMMNRTGACRRRSPVRSHWRWLSARWHLAQTGECQGRAFGWQRQASGEWEAGCGRRLNPRCPADGWSAAGACAEPPGWQGRGSSTLDWRERRKEKKNGKQRKAIFIYLFSKGGEVVQFPADLTWEAEHTLNRVTAHHGVKTWGQITVHAHKWKEDVYSDADVNTERLPGRHRGHEPVQGMQWCCKLHSAADHKYSILIKHFSWTALILHIPFTTIRSQSSSSVCSNISVTVCLQLVFF